MYLGGDKMTYRNEEYSGLAASGRIWLDIDLPSQSLNFLVFDGEMAAGIFGGMNGSDLYLKGYGNSHASAALQFPDSWPLVGGWNLLGVGVDTAVAAETLIQGSSDGRFTITYCTKPELMSKEEIESVGYQWADYNEVSKRYDPHTLKEGWNTLPDGEEIYFIGTPALGLWKCDD